MLKRTLSIILGIFLFYNTSGQSFFGYSNSLDGFSNENEYFFNHANESDYNYVNFHIQGRLTNKLDYKVTFGDGEPGIFLPYVQISFPYFFNNLRTESGFGKGFYLEPIISYGKNQNHGVGAGLGIGYQYNYGIFSAFAGAKTVFESSGVFQRFGTYYDSYIYEAYLGIGIHLPRSKKRIHPPEVEAARKTRIWITASIGSDDQYNAYSGRVEASFKKYEWFSLGFEYIRTQTGSAYHDLNTGITTFSSIPVNGYMIRFDARPVQAFHPLSSWDPFIGAGFGVLTYPDIGEPQYGPSLHTGLRYWITDHFGIHVEAGVLLKLGFHTGLAYRF
ncbi:MAG: hypothetical protein HWE14_04290 [Flavobacteriia bacterium]|nr:hypothetical protein [Flavobacteriia bacterium]